MRDDDDVVDVLLCCVKVHCIRRLYDLFHLLNKR